MSGVSGTRRRLVAQEGWHDCCQSTNEHRFDCATVPAEQRGAGPFGPTTVPKLIVDEPSPGTLRVREVVS